MQAITTAPFALLAAALLAPATGCAPDEDFFDTDGVEFRDTTTTGTTWSCATCGFNDPEVNGYEVPDLDRTGMAENDDHVRFLSLKNPADVTYKLGTVGDELVALNWYDQIVAQGAQLIGWKLYVSTAGVTRKILITSYDDTISSWKTNGSPMSAYGMAYLEDPPHEAWRNVCPEHIDSPFEATVTVLAGETYDRDNKLVNANMSTWFTLACRDQAAYKMKRMSYGPHGDYTGTNPVVAANPDQRQATLKMITADYCGTGKSFTESGTPVYWRNRLDTVVAGQFVRANTEALWNDEGAICLSYPRIATLAEVAQECNLPLCTQAMYDAGNWEWITRKP